MLRWCLLWLEFYIPQKFMRRNHLCRAARFTVFKVINNLHRGRWLQKSMKMKERSWKWVITFLYLNHRYRFVVYDHKKINLTFFFIPLWSKLQKSQDHYEERCILVRKLQVIRNGRWGTKAFIPLKGVLKRVPFRVQRLKKRFQGFKDSRGQG